MINNKMNHLKVFRIISFSLLFIFALHTNAQENLVTRTGHVVSAAGQGIENVVVNIENTSTGTITIADGKFEIRAKKGDIIVFRKIKFSVRRVTVGDPKDLGNIILKTNENQSEITGTINDSQGIPLIGATVRIMGTAEGTTTDFNGLFSLRAWKGDKIEISYIGYKTQVIEITDNTQLTITLAEDANLLEEVVLTAFAIEREKKSLGYSVQQVSSEDINDAQETSVAQSLQGRVAGLQIAKTGSGAGSSSKITIRGISSLTGNSTPLIVVDGIPIDNSTPAPAGNATGNVSSQTTSNFDYGDGLGNLNQDDIASISVLKGPNAAGLYGTRGANGVILITTKKGKDRPGLGISFSSALTSESPFVFPELQNVYGIGSGGAFPIQSNANGLPSSLGTLNVASWGPAFDGRQYENWNGVVSPYTAQPNPIKRFYESGFTAANTLSINGGNEKTTFYLSLSNVSNQGIVPDSKYKRNNITLRSSHQISDKVSIDGKVSYIKQNGENRASGGASPFNTVGPLFSLSRDIKINDLSENFVNPNGNPISPFLFQTENPYWITNRLRNTDQRDRLIGSLSLNYKISERLSLSVRSGIDTYFDNRFVRIPKNSQSLPIGNLRFTDFSLTEINSDFLLKYSTDSSKDFTASISAGGNFLNRKTRNQTTSGSGLKISGLDNISNASNTLTNTINTEREIQSLYSFASFGYKRFIYLDLTGRNDWSSVLPSKNQSFFYPSATSSLVVSSLFELPKFINLFKLRGSWAEAGNDGSQLYQDRLYLDILNNPAPNGGTLAGLPSSLANLDLKNELTTSIEYGAELILFKNRVNLDFTLYESETENQILTSPISQTAGFATRIFNAGKIENKGIEASLRTTPVLSENFEWNVNLNFSQNENTVIELDDDVDELVLNSLAATSVNKITIKARPGEPFGNLYGREFLRNDRGELLLSAQGLPLATDEEVLLGNSQPDWLGSIANIFKYKGFSLSTLIEFSQGGEFYSETKALLATKGSSVETLANRDNFLLTGTLANGEANTIATTAQLYYEQLDLLNIASPFIEDASYISLREISLGYTVPSKWLDNTFFKKVKVSAFGRNVAYLQRKATHVAPEATLFSPRSNDVGIEFLTLPFTRNLGLKLNFEF